MTLVTESKEGESGEKYTKLDCSLFLDAKEYRKYHDILIPASPRSAQIDHVIVSEFGIFVLETKTMNGWIYGDKDGPTWTQVFRHKKFVFQNPLRQNYFHVKVLAKFLNISTDKIFPIVVFWGDCEFQTDMPENVRRRAFIQYIQRKKQILMTKDEVNNACRMLRESKEKVTDASRQVHVDLLNSTVKCPRCGGKLAARIVKRGAKAGTKFYGCANFPECRYSRNWNHDQ